MLRFEFGGKPQDAVSQIPLPCFDFLFREETWNVLWVSLDDDGDSGLAAPRPFNPSRYPPM
jgi:hypothetical protein